MLQVSEIHVTIVMNLNIQLEGIMKHKNLYHGLILLFFLQVKKHPTYIQGRWLAVPMSVNFTQLYIKHELFLSL